MRIVVFATFALVGCGEAPSPAPAPSRTASVAATPAPDVSTDDFCDVRPEPAGTFAMPELDGAAPPATPGWGWVNVWATWCSPCIEEMPRLADWEGRLRDEVGPGSVRFLSADAQASDVATFRTKHPDAPPSARIASFDALEPWLRSVGLDAAAVLPIHIFLDRSDRIRCIRMGAVKDEDYPTVKRLISEG